MHTNNLLSDFTSPGYHTNKALKKSAVSPAAVQGASSSLAWHVLCLSVLRRWNRFVPLAGTEEKGRWGYTASSPFNLCCVNLWHRLYVFQPLTGCSVRPERWLFALSICADALTLNGHSQTSSSPLTPLESPLILFSAAHPFSPPYSPDLSVGYILLNSITPSLQGGKKSQRWGWTISDRQEHQTVSSCCLLLALCSGGVMRMTRMMVMRAICGSRKPC